jgi:hypothetical protein
VNILRNGRFLLVAALVVVLAGGAFWWLRRPEQIPTRAPAGAPAIGSCWSVASAEAAGAFPWSGSPVPCTDNHTVEIYYLGQVDAALIRQQHRAKGSDRTIADNLMYAQVRIACGNFASVHLGGSWHTGRVRVVADWVTPVRDGFFACGLAEVADAAGDRFVGRTTGLKGALAGDAAARLAISCADGSGVFVGCDRKHRSEYVGTYTITPQNAPFNAAGLQTAVLTGCTQLVGRFLGGQAGPGRTDVTAAYVGPTTASDWLGSDQTYACYAKTATDVVTSIHNLGTRPLPA